MIVNYLNKDEKYKIEASNNPNSFCIYLIDRHALISVNNGDTWKHVKKYIDKPRPATKSCSICFEDQFNRMISCSKCFADTCVLCTTTILEKNCGQIPCPFCRNVVGIKLPPVMVQIMCQGICLDAMRPPEAFLVGLLH